MVDPEPVGPGVLLEQLESWRMVGVLARDVAAARRALGRADERGESFRWVLLDGDLARTDTALLQDLTDRDTSRLVVLDHAGGDAPSIPQLHPVPHEGSAPTWPRSRAPQRASS